MTPKEEYETRKAARNAKKETHAQKELDSEEMMDRFITAVERIADALEAMTQPRASHDKR